MLLKCRYTMLFILDWDVGMYKKASRMSLHRIECEFNSTFLIIRHKIRLLHSFLFFAIIFNLLRNSNSLNLQLAFFVIVTTICFSYYSHFYCTPSVLIATFILFSIRYCSSFDNVHWACNCFIKAHKNIHVAF